MVTFALLCVNFGPLSIPIISNFCVRTVMIRCNTLLSDYADTHRYNFQRHNFCCSFTPRCLDYKEIAPPPPILLAPSFELPLAPRCGRKLNHYGISSSSEFFSFCHIFCMLSQPGSHFFLVSTEPQNIGVYPLNSHLHLAICGSSRWIVLEKFHNLKTERIMLRGLSSYTHYASPSVPA